MSDRDLLDAVETWACSRKLSPRVSGFKHATAPWAVDTRSRHSDSLVLVQQRDEPANIPHAWRVDLWTAALWALLVDAELRADVGVCPACHARSASRGKLARWVWYAGVTYGVGCDRWWVRNSHKEDMVTRFGEHVQVGAFESGPTRETPNVRRGGLARTTQVIAVYPCSACTVDGEPTGRKPVDAARLLLDAHDQTFTNPTIGERVHPRMLRAGHEWVIPGDSDAREHLAVLADKLTDEGSELGELIVGWLAPLESHARDELRPLLLWLVTLAAVRVASVNQLDALAAGVQLVRTRDVSSYSLPPETDEHLRARVEFAMRECRPKRVAHASAPENKSTKVVAIF